MKLLADLHTHSKYSRLGHGKNNIEEMAIAANEIGLVEIGITDHGYSHFFRTTKNKLKQARKIVDEINAWSKTKVLLGIEADIIREDGTLDIDNETLSMLDILIVGYHRMTFTDFAGFFGNVKKTDRARKKCTNAFINAIRKYPVTIVSHLDSVLTTDLYEIGKVCRERGTMVEINNRHTKWTEKQMADLIDSGCMFVVSSDAHSRNMVGEIDRAIDYIRKYNIPSERVVNIQFSEEEKSELDREFSAYRSVYEQVAKAKKAKEEAMETRFKTEITGTLSAEMEKALKDIARQKGLHYEERKPESIDGVYMKDSYQEDDMDDLVSQAEEYIRNQELQTIQHENEQVLVDEEENDEIEYSFEDDHPLVKDAFADRFQALNSVIKQNESVETRRFENLNETNYASKKLNNDIPAYKQLSGDNITSGDMKNLKNMIGERNQSLESVVGAQEKTVKQASQFKKVEPEHFMDSITQTRLANNTKSTASKSSKPQVSKTSGQRGGQRGAFIVVDNLLSSDKK